MSVDLKDMCFYIQIGPRHRHFLRFAFKDTAYQLKVLPFGLALAPRTFTKCVNVVLSPLRQSGMHILNYLDNWLIIAQSQDVLESHREQLLEHLQCLELSTMEEHAPSLVEHRILVYDPRLAFDASTPVSGPCTIATRYPYSGWGNRFL